jgi:hypothetical protein
MKSKYVIALFFIFFFFILFKDFNKPTYPEKILLKKFKENAEKKLINDYSFIAHAGGGYKGKTYTNSYDAVENSIASGFKFIELDILKTSDNYLIAAHDWKGLKNECKNLSFTSDNAITLKEFENCNLEFRKLSHKDISRFFDQQGEFKKNELYLVTDQINDYKILNKYFLEHHRLLVEINSIKDFLFARFNNISIKVFNFTNARRNIIYVKIFNIKFINIHTAYIDQYKDFLIDYLKSGNVVFAYTSNDVDFVKKNLNKTVSAFYTDFIDLKTLECTEKIKDPVSKDPCHTY